MSASCLKTCETCGSDFRVPPSRVRTARFCSPDCCGKAKTGVPRSICLNGHDLISVGFKSFTRDGRDYRSCNACKEARRKAANNRYLTSHPPRERVCKGCGTQYHHRRRVFCSEDCKAEYWRTYNRNSAKERWRERHDEMLQKQREWRVKNSDKVRAQHQRAWQRTRANPKKRAKKNRAHLAYYYNVRRSRFRGCIVKTLCPECAAEIVSPPAVLYQLFCSDGCQRAFHRGRYGRDIEFRKLEKQRARKERIQLKAIREIATGLGLGRSFAGDKAGDRERMRYQCSLLSAFRELGLIQTKGVRDGIA